VLSSGSITSAVDLLLPGSTLCLSGTFTEDVEVTTPAITITSADKSTPAVVNGFVEVKRGANGTRIDGLQIDASGQSQNGVQVYANAVAITNNDIQSAQSSCLYVGSRTYGVANAPLIDHNRIHNCGESYLDHGLYVDEAYGGRISNNYVYDASQGFGFQLYKRTVGFRIDHNVFDGNGLSGILISGDTTSTDSTGCAYSHGNTITNNIFTFNGQYGVGHWWGCTVGYDNVVAFNCWYGNGDGDYDSPFGYTEHDNVHADPLYLDRASHDYSLRAGSPCAGMGPQ
jgi:Right handed beta helix region